MATFDITELSVCTVCIHLLANGEYDDGTDAAEIAAAGMQRIWGADTVHLVPGVGCLGHCSSDCDGCGDTLAGDRFEAAALIPVPVFEQIDSQSEHDVKLWEVTTSGGRVMHVRTNGNGGFGPVNVWDGQQWHAVKYRKII